MQQVETLGKSIDKFLILGSILAQVNLGLAVAGIVVILTAGQEIVTRLIVVLVKNGYFKFVSKLPALLRVTVDGMLGGACGTYNHNLRILGANLVIYKLETLLKLGSDFLLVSKTQILQVERLRMTCIGTNLTPL